MGTSLYNWWNVNLCKNVSKDKRDYSNQIPEELLERIILSTTNKGDLVADPFSELSTSRTAMRLGRRAWGCDLNPEVIKWRPTIADYKQNLEREFQSSSTIENIHFTSYKKPESPKHQFEKIVVHLFENTSAENLAKAPGIGIKKQKRIGK